jgi:hypothetical protein
VDRRLLKHFDGLHLGLIRSSAVGALDSSIDKARSSLSVSILPRSPLPACRQPSNATSKSTGRPGLLAWTRHPSTAHCSGDLTRSLRRRAAWFKRGSGRSERGPHSAAHFSNGTFGSFAVRHCERWAVLGPGRSLPLQLQNKRLFLGGTNWLSFPYKRLWKRCWQTSAIPFAF